MPTYVYRCDSCSHQFEIFQKMSDDALDTCPQCAAAVRRVIHPVGIVFKGSGWYVTDSKSANGSNTGAAAAKDDKSESAATTSSSEGDKKTTAKEPAKTAAD